VDRCIPCVLVSVCCVAVARNNMDARHADTAVNMTSQTDARGYDVINEEQRITPFDCGGLQTDKHNEKFGLFTARCYAERGYATVYCLSVCLSVCP